MVKTLRTTNDNIFYFLKEHPDLKVELQKGNVINVIFPPNCISSTLLIQNGKIAFLQYCTTENEDLITNTYDSSKDSSYEENLYNVIQKFGKC